MVSINMSENEIELNLEILKKEEKNLHSEIHHTDNHDFRESLKQKLDMLKNLIQKFSE